MTRQCGAPTLAGPACTNPVTDGNDIHCAAGHPVKARGMSTPAATNQASLSSGPGAAFDLEDLVETQRRDRFLAEMGLEPLTHLPPDPEPPDGPWGRGPQNSDEWSSTTLTTTRKVPIASLYATEAYIHTETADAYRRGERTSRTLPRVAVEGGKAFLIDGHHRTLTAHERGETHIRARVWQGRVHQP
jgi:hypothetical protein